MDETDSERNLRLAHEMGSRISGGHGVAAGRAAGGRKTEALMLQALRDAQRRGVAAADIPAAISAALAERRG